MIRVHVAAERSISSAMEDRKIGKKFEHDFDRADSDWIFAPGLDVQYQWNLEALGLIASMLSKT